MNIKTMIKAAEAAGKLALKYFRSDFLKYETKSSSADLVTEIDIASQNEILDVLSKNCPGIPIITEEKNPQTYPEKYFLVDPLDGTLNYFHGIPLFCVSIALVDKGYPVLGVVHVPTFSETFTAEKSKGAYLNSKRIQVSNKLRLEDALCVTGWPYNKKLHNWTQNAVRKMLEVTQEVRILGSAALELCYIAAGNLDIYFEIGLSPWDIAAGYLIASEAGATVSSISVDGFELNLGEILATSPAIYADTLKILRKSSE
ncbi:inositol monophosphatase family protein [Kosmotoga sp. DU53]|uniref:inositol monophosphatase family protein n=1 Tax=Kosmotoga sp. DU53 TaxID=1310160 RepID=UPI0007C4B762|nr:inositol monophosphatase family protein [Kosmotoga sp. DU53]OAA24872.1 hypothetical protein DU53_00720 [Kosmotoga sp. DU53]